MNIDDYASYNNNNLLLNNFHKSTNYSTDCLSIEFFNKNSSNSCSINNASNKEQKTFSNKLTSDVNNKEYKNIYVTKEGRIILETNSLYYSQTAEFLIAISEPIHRTLNFHEYQLTIYSLYAAASMNIKTEEILSILEAICINSLPIEVENYIKKNTETYGKVKLILKDQKYYIQCKDTTTKNFLLKNSVIANSYYLQVKKKENIVVLNHKNLGVLNNNEIESSTNILSNGDNENINNIIKKIANTSLLEKELDEIEKNQNVFEVDPLSLEDIKKTCIDIGFPLLEEYDFKNDKLNPNLEIETKLKSSIRPYQEKALSIMFKYKRARSGIIVLPCGAGKTLVGILTTCTIKKSTVILCNSAVSVEQWYREVLNWTNIDPSLVCRFTSKRRDSIWDVKSKGGILITTYTMISFNRKRSSEVEDIINNKIKGSEWGLLVMDEVQVVPAEMFRKTLLIIKSHCKLGLTATLVREDSKIDDLNFLIGPKHYEANWADLQREGYLARVQCIEIWTEMYSSFYEHYISGKLPLRKKMMLYFSNPNKLLICKSLIKHHKNDKIIIFCDDLYTLDIYARELRIPFITGGVSHYEREKFITEFRETNNYNCLIMSKVGDTSIDIPNANVIIQISSHFGSRRQEAQRLGRILRPKPNSISQFNAFFYSIVSKNTEEMYFSNKRHKFLIDQGYCFKVITNLEDIKIDNEYKNFETVICSNSENLNSNKIEEFNRLSNKFKAMLDDIKSTDIKEIEEDSISDVEFVDNERSDIDIQNEIIEEESNNDYDEYDDSTNNNIL